jgi:hypothetical protein
MGQIPWETALSVFIGTLPMLGVVAWNLMDVKSLRVEMRSEFTAIRAELSLIRTELTKLTERVAILEERDRHNRLVTK